MGDHFRNLWGKQAGWAHSVLFAADLRTFSSRLNAKVESVEVKKEEDEDVTIDTRVKSEEITERNLKREIMEEAITTAVGEVSAARPAKRRRRGSRMKE